MAWLLPGFDPLPRWWPALGGGQASREWMPLGIGSLGEKWFRPEQTIRGNRMGEGIWQIQTESGPAKEPQSLEILTDLTLRMNYLIRPRPAPESPPLVPSDPFRMVAVRVPAICR